MMSKDLKGHTIAVIGRANSGKTAFIKAVCNAASDAPVPHTAHDTPTPCIVEYKAPLSNGQFLTFLDTPGFDGHQADGPGSESAKNEDILRMLEEYVAANGVGPISHTLVFLNTDEMTMLNFAVLPRQAFERLISSSTFACITTRWDQIENDNGRPFSAEEVESMEESLYTNGKTGGSLFEYLENGGNGRGDGGLLRFRSGLPIEGEAPSSTYSLPQDIMHKLFGGQVLDTTLRERLAAMTKERDDLAAKYALLLEERQAPTVVADAAPGSQEAVRTRTSRTRRQRLLDTINTFSAQVLEMVADLDREALDVVDECTANRDAIQAASAAIEVAQGILAEKTEIVKAAEEDSARLKKTRDSFAEMEQSLVMQLDGLETTGGQSSVGVFTAVKQRIDTNLEQTRASLKDMEGWVSTAEECHQRGRQEVERAAAEIENWRRIEQGKGRELKEWLSPESERLSKEQESFQTLQESLSTNLDVMRQGLEDSWEGKLGKNSLFLERLGGHTVDPEMVAHPGDWAPAIELFYDSQVTLALAQEMVKFHSAVLQQLKTQEDSALREWKKGVEDIFGSVPKDLHPTPSPLSGHASSVTSAAFSWDGTKIVSGSGDKTVRVWDVLTGELQTVLEGHTGGLRSVAFSPDGKHIVSGAGDETVRVWDVLGARVKSVLKGHSSSVWSVDFSADGSRIVSGSLDWTVCIWDVSTGEVQRILKGHTSSVCSAVFSGDGSKVFSGSDDKSVRVWNALTGEVCAVLRGHRAYVTAVASSSDGLRVASGSGDKTVRVWDVLTGNVLRVLEGHIGSVWSVSISRNGSVCSGSDDKTLRVWDASTGTSERVLEGHSGTVRAVAFSRDGRRIVSGSYDKTVRVWDTPTPHESS